MSYSDLIHKALNYKIKIHNARIQATQRIKPPEQTEEKIKKKKIKLTKSPQQTLNKNIRKRLEKRKKQPNTNIKYAQAESNTDNIYFQSGNQNYYMGQK